MHGTTLTSEYWERTRPAAQHEGLALSQALPVLRRSWAWIVLPTLAVAVAAGAFVHVVPPRYTAETKILLENREPGFARNAAERGEPAAPLDEQGVASQVQVAMSRDLAREAIRRLKLVGNPEFDPGVGEIGPVRRALMLMGLSKAGLDAKPEDRVLESYFDRLLVFPAGKSRILSVEFRSADPALAAKAANTISELYLDSLEAAKTDTARYASTWLGGNIEALRARVAEAEAKVEGYRAKNGLIGAGGAASQPLGNQQLGELSSQLSQARTIKADLTARAKMLKEMIKDGRAFEIPDVANNELIRRTVESRMSMRAQLALESRTLLPAHPRIKELTAQLEDLETQIKAAAERIVRTLDNDARIAGARVESLQAAVDGQRDVVAQGNTSEIQLRALEREAKAQREQLESYLARYREAAARNGESATPAEARIVSRAVVPETPSFPKKVPVVTVATVLAFLLSAAAVLGRHLLRSPEPTRAAGAKHAPGPRERPASELQEMFSDRFDYPEPLPPQAGNDGVSAEPEGGVRVAARGQAPSAPAETEAMPAVAGAAAQVDAPGQDAPATDGSVLEEPASAEAGPAVRTRLSEETGSVEPDASDEPETASELDGLIERLSSAGTEAGRCVLVVETARPAAGAPGLARTLADVLAARAPTLQVDAGGAGSGEPGLTDLVAGEAAFPEVIQAVPGSSLHRIGLGFIEREVLLEEPHGLAIALNAMAQSYDWTICRLDLTGRDAASGTDLLYALSACMDSVVIASQAGPDDAGLIALYERAIEAGAGQVLVAQDAPAAADEEPQLELRLSA